MFFFSFECALWTDSSVTADIHTARFVVSVSIKPHLQEEEKVFDIKAVALVYVSPIHDLGLWHLPEAVQRLQWPRLEILILSLLPLLSSCFLSVLMRISKASFPLLLLKELLNSE